MSKSATPALPSLGKQEKLIAIGLIVLAVYLYLRYKKNAAGQSGNSPTPGTGSDSGYDAERNLLRARIDNTDGFEDNVIPMY